MACCVVAGNSNANLRALAKMEALVDGILGGDKDEYQQLLQQLLVLVEKGEVSLASLIANKSLADAFTSQSDNKRAKGT